MTTIEWWPIIAARRIGTAMGAAMLPECPEELAKRGEIMDACQAFLEAHGPEYESVRDWNRRMAMVGAR
jgi:hypothetical protein